MSPFGGGSPEDSASDPWGEPWTRRCSRRVIGANQLGGRPLAVKGRPESLHRVVVIGNVATLPPARGRGAAGACVAQLLPPAARGRRRPVGLNVHADHATARGLCERLGFTVSAAFEEAVFSAR
ncbi:GNAT family N-acetyltransferase [Kitasatospora sp. NPDC002965]|uniref:GNAT family N-acetyltransferase n=1 Tax=Kitasatospora sp. NPDC002965 TaxID=3154775 RepID=UPI0033B9A139